MKIILAATPVPGHVRPILAAARMLATAGHEVVMTTASVFRSEIEAADVPFHALPKDADLDMVDINAAFPERKTIPPGPAQFRFDFERIFVDPIPAQFAGLETMLREFPADLIVVDSFFGGAMPFMLGARATRPAIVALSITFLGFHRDDGAPMGLGLPPATNAEQVEQYKTIAEQVHAGFTEPIKARVDALLRGLGASTLPMSYTDALVVLNDAFLHPTVASFEYPRRDMPKHVRFIGALPAPAGEEIPAEIVDAMAQGRRVVLVTQGTVANFNLGQLLGPTLAGLAERPDLLVLATTGGRPISEVPGPMPPNAIVTTYLPFDKLMRHVDVLVTNGGYGTIMQALSLGIPVVAAGTTEDKPEVAARVAWSGVGIDLHTDMPSPAAVRDAVTTLLEEGQYRSRAKAVAAELAGFDTPRELCEQLENVVAARLEVANAG